MCNNSPDLSSVTTIVITAQLIQALDFILFYLYSQYIFMFYNLQFVWVNKPTVDLMLSIEVVHTVMF